MRAPALVAALVAAGLAAAIGARIAFRDPGSDAETTPPGAEFRPPSLPERLAAIGPLDDLDPAARAALTPGDAFEAIPSPGSNDWLANHEEPGQTFQQYVASAPNRPDADRNKIYLLPIGEFAERAPDLERLRYAGRIYFRLEVELLPTLPLADLDARSRVDRLTGNRQLLTGDLLRELETRLPRDAFCLLGVTMEDLFPDEAWNFVFGQASLRGRVGIYGFARYDPLFYGSEPTDTDETVILLRALKVLVHETCHMFGMLHCVHHRCVVNGSNHHQEMDAQPVHLCPVCLRKLQWSLGFDYGERYLDLETTYRELGFGGLGEWVRARADVIGASR